VVGLVITEPGTIRLEAVDAVPANAGGRPYPDQPAELGPDEVAGVTLHTLLSPGTEIAAMFAPPDLAKATPYPWSPGYAATFRIDEIGSAVEGLAPGDVVFSLGGHRSRQRERADQVWKLPVGLAPERAVFARLMGIPMTTLTTTTARPGASVGVSGLGAVGHFAAKVFAAAGYRVTGWDPVPSRRDLMPPSVTVLADAPSPLPVERLGSTAGFELILECSGHDGAVMAAVQAVRSRGEVVLVGAPWRRYTDATAHDLLDHVFHRYVVLRSGWEWEVPARPAPFAHGSASANIALALDWLAAGTVSTDGVGQVVSPEQAQEVYASYADRSARWVTTVFDWTAVPPARVGGG
jgi:NADPH:quinone reductase-like Zn-dependent oxidoreductase